jgi:hypothetical protein
LEKTDGAFTTTVEDDGARFTANVQIFVALVKWDRYSMFQPMNSIHLRLVVVGNKSEPPMADVVT